MSGWVHSPALGHPYVVVFACVLISIFGPKLSNYQLFNRQVQSSTAVVSQILVVVTKVGGGGLQGAIAIAGTGERGLEGVCLCVRLIYMLQ